MRAGFKVEKGHFSHLEIRFENFKSTAGIIEGTETNVGAFIKLNSTEKYSLKVGAELSTELTSNTEVYCFTEPIAS